MGFEIFHPEGISRHLIKYYWFLEENNSQNTLQQVIPEGNPRFLYYQEGSGKNNISGELQPDIFICGQKDAYSELEVSSDCKVFGIDFHPFALGFFKGISAHELRGLEIQPNDLFADLRDRIIDLLNHPISKIEKVKLMDQLFSKIQNIDHYELKILTNVLREIEKPGTNKISAIAKHFHLTERTLERKFLRYIGLPPKRYRRIKRFNLAFEHLKEYQGSLTEFAYDLGYYDQSHFIRDMKAFAGMTPKILQKILNN